MVFSRTRSGSQHTNVTQQELNESIEGLSVVLGERGADGTATPQLGSRSSSFLLPHKIREGTRTPPPEGPGKTFSVEHKGETQYFRMGVDESTTNIKDTIRCVFGLPPADNFNLVDSEGRNVIVSASSLVHTAHYTLLLPIKPPVSYIDVPCTPLPRLIPPADQGHPKSISSPPPEPRENPPKPQPPAATLLDTLKKIAFVSLLFAAVFLALSSVLSDGGVDVLAGPPPLDATYPAVWRNEAGSVLVRYVTPHGTIKDHTLTEGVNAIPDTAKSVFSYDGGVVTKVADEL